MKKKIVYSVDPVVRASAQLQKQIDEELEEEQEEKSIGALLDETQSNSERGESSSN